MTTSLPTEPAVEAATERTCPTTPDQTVAGLATLQFGPRSVDGYQVHLVRSRKREHGGGTPGPTLCGIDRSGPNVGWSVGGGVSGPDITHTPCPGCSQAARQLFPGLPVWGLGAERVAAELGVPSHWHSSGPPSNPTPQGETDGNQR